MPVHHLHDGLPLLFFNSKPTPQKRPAASLAALQWAADRAGLSYGRFIRGLMPADESRIQEEFEGWKAEEKRRREARPRVDTPSTSTPDKECDV